MFVAGVDNEKQLVVEGFEGSFCDFNETFDFIFRTLKAFEM